MNALLLEVMVDFIILCIGFILISLLLRGFFWKYLKVRISLGALVLVKVREINRDLYAVGKIEENRLVYKLGKEKKSIILKKDKTFFYKTLGITMIDVDSEKNALCSVNYEAVDGFDAVKQENLYIRALTKPQITDNKERIIIIALVILVIATIFIAYNMLKQGQTILLIKQTVDSLNKGLVTATSTI